MMMLKADQLRLKNILTEAIMLLCKNALSYDTEFSIEGLLGITLDKSEIFLINIRETINKVAAAMSIVDDPDDAILDLVVREHIETAGNDDFLIEDLSLKPSQKLPKCAHYGGKSKNDSMDKSRDSSGSLDLSMGDIGLGGNVHVHPARGGKDDNLNMIVPDMAAAYAKYVDLDPMALLTSATSRVRDVGDDMDLVEDLSMSVTNQVSVFNQDVLNMMEKEDAISAAAADSVAVTTSASEITVKEEHFNAIAQADMSKYADPMDHSGNLIVNVTTDPPETLVIDATMTTPAVSVAADAILPAEEQPEPAATSAAASAATCWEQGEKVQVEKDLCLPQDLTMNEKEKKAKPKVACPQCGKRYKSEQGLKKHKCKAQTDGSTQPHTGETTQPLDLTICRSDDETMGPDHDPSDLDPSDLALSTESFTCICSKTLSDYDAYAEHLATCSKSKLTPYKACDICGKYFFSTSGYVKHKRLHVGAYKFRCSVCHKGFFDRTHLGAHMDSSHSKVRRYECPFCQRSFFWKHHLKRHHGTCCKAKEMKRLQHSKVLPLLMPAHVSNEDSEMTIQTIVTEVTEEQEVARQESVDSGTAEQIDEDALNVSLDLTIS